MVCWASKLFCLLKDKVPGFGSGDYYFYFDYKGLVRYVCHFYVIYFKWFMRDWT